MAQLIVRKLNDDAKRRLEARASRNARSVEEEARAILEEAVIGDVVPVLRNDEKGFGDLMYERFKDSGLTPGELRRFNIGVAEINSMSEMRTPDFEAEDFEETDSKT